MRLGAVIRKWRQVSGLTLRDAAGMMAIPLPTLARLERGHPCDSLTLSRLLKWLLEHNVKK